ncbi:MAG: lipolytic protein G-D-S-L family [Bacteroidetes bacterium]|nr:MAG: lipolytic protein G-D-S-L family [Bacteroidota bacterium]
MRRFTVIVLCFMIATVILMSFMQQKKQAAVRFLPLGDSYTICEGAKPAESWPVLLTAHLEEKGHDIALLANPARTGFTTFDLMQEELPVLDKSDANFVTLCIGVNDWVRGIDSTVFKKNFSLILDRIQRKIPDKQKIIVLTIPDFSVTPNGKLYGNGRDISKGIAAFNGIVTREANKRKLKIVDLYPISKGMADNDALVARDGLHPSAQEYAIWEKAILPVAVEILKP